MDFASLRAKLDNIAEELAQLPEQETVAIEEEEVEEGSRDKEHELYSLMRGGPADSGIAKLPKKIKKEEEAVEEATVEIPVQELADIMQLAGYSDYAERIEEYANEPDEQYMDAEEQLVGLSGGLNGPKTMHPPAADGDNPMDTKPREVEEVEEDAISSVEESLYKSYQAFLEEAEIKDDEVVAEGKMSPEDELEMLKANVKNPAQSDEAKEKMKARIKELEEMIKKED